jgi:transcriptional regulator with XRE-family HTH domain
MVNTDDFIKRLEYLMDYNALNASAFADKIGVQRSSISHLLSGRNKPSLDFIMKILEVFPDINLYWILEGKQEFLKSDQKNKIEIVQKPLDLPPTKVIKEEEQKIEENLFSETNVFVQKANENLTAEAQTKKIFGENSEIYKIVIFYNDGTFDDFMKK